MLSNLLTSKQREHEPVPKTMVPENAPKGSVFAVGTPTSGPFSVDFELLVLMLTILSWNCHDSWEKITAKTLAFDLPSNTIADTAQRGSLILLFYSFDQVAMLSLNDLNIADPTFSDSSCFHSPSNNIYCTLKMIVSRVKCTICLVCIDGGDLIHRTWFSWGWQQQKPAPLEPKGFCEKTQIGKSSKTRTNSYLNSLSAKSEEPLKQKIWLVLCFLKLRS